MSRQFDEHMEGFFELNADEYRIIDPSNVDELAQAYEVKQVLQEAITLSPQDGVTYDYQNLLREQTNYIAEYVDSIEPYNSKVLSSNITYLCKQKNLKMSNLEDAIGVSTGYISRTIGEKSTKKMSIDTLWKISKLFDTGIDTLITRELSVVKLNKDEQFILSIIEKMLNDCEDCKISWVRETPKDMLVTSPSDGYPTHPLMHIQEYYDYVSADYPEVVDSRVEFNSKFFSDDHRIDLLGNCYHTDLPGTSSTVYIAHIRHDRDSVFYDEQYELYSIANNKVTPICASLSSKEEIAKALEKLYKVIDGTFSTVGLPKEIRNELEHYLNNKSSGDMSSVN